MNGGFRYTYTRLDVTVSFVQTEKFDIMVNRARHSAVPDTRGDHQHNFVSANIWQADNEATTPTKQTAHENPASRAQIAGNHPASRPHQAQTGAHAIRWTLAERGRRDAVALRHDDEQTGPPAVRVGRAGRSRRLSLHICSSSWPVRRRDEPR